MALDPSILLKADAPFDLGASFRAAEDRQRAIGADQRQAKMDTQNITANDAKIRMAQLDEAGKKMDLTMQALGRARDQATYDKERAWLSSMGIDVSKEPAVFDPSYIQQQQMAALDMVDKLKIAREEALNNARIATEGARTRSYDALAAQRNADEGGGPTMQPTFAAPVNGLQPPPALPGETGPRGMPAPNAPLQSFPTTLTADQKRALDYQEKKLNPKLTEGQANAALYADRMTESDKIISGMENSKVFNDPTLNARSSSPLTNWTVGEEGQKAVQAQRDFINAVLRRESGAVISDQEFDNARKQYFPQPGDKAATIQQKKANRDLAIQGIKAAAGPASAKKGGEDPLGIR